MQGKKAASSSIDNILRFAVYLYLWCNYIMIMCHVPLKFMCGQEKAEWVRVCMAYEEILDISYFLD